MTRTASGGCGRLTHGGGLALLLEIVYSKLENRPKFSWKTEKRLQRHPPAGGVVKYRVDYLNGLPELLHLERLGGEGEGG